MDDNRNSSPETPQGDGNDPLKEVRRTVLHYFREDIFHALEASLAVICSFSLKGRTNPLALIIEGPSGGGKSTVINMCEPNKPETAGLICRVDNFTPKSFVSHAASVTSDKLKDVDLLPKIKDKTMLTKELAPLFRGKESDLRDKFSMLTTVLDGKGYKSSSGVHGMRGYEGQYLFNWVGATTPIPADTDTIMAQLGNRLLRFELEGCPQSKEELIDFAINSEAENAEVKCRKVVNDFILQHFERHPLSSVDLLDFKNLEEVSGRVVNFALLLAQGRVEVTRIPVDGWDHEFVAGHPEGPQRIILILMTFLKAHALIHGRRVISAEDLDLLQHLAFSSIPQTRRQILRAVLMARGELSSTDAAERLDKSQPTARAWMKELAATGIVKYHKKTGNSADLIRVTDEWAWLLGDGSEPPGGARAASVLAAAESEVGMCAYAAAES